MSPLDSNQVASALAAFATAELGDGDIVAGANVLTAMAFTLANVRRSDTRIAFSDAASVPVGCSTLAAGALSVALVQEKVLRPLAERQNNCAAHLRNWARLTQHKANLPIAARGLDPIQLLTPSANSPLADLHGQTILFPGTAPAASRLTRPPDDYGKHELHERPIVYATARDDRELEQALAHAHRGRALIHLGIDDPRSFSSFAANASALMEGRYPVGPYGESVHGAVVVTASSLASLEDDECFWLTKMPWLTDSPAGPLPDFDPAPAVVTLDGIQDRFALALEEAFGHRLDYHKQEPYHVTIPTKSRQRRWLSQLHVAETTWPGITGVARPWLSTLVFGLNELVRAQRLPEKFKWSIAAAEALAYWQVLRMLNARMARTRSSHDAHIARIANTLCHRLDGTPKKLRDLVRGFHRLPTRDCEEALESLARSGVAMCSGSGWHLTPTCPPKAHESHDPIPALDV